MLDHLLDDHKNLWPVAHWKPEPHEDFSSDLCLKITSVQSVIAYAFLAIAAAVSGDEAFSRFGSYWAVVAVLLFAACYGLMRLGLARMWNRRAARLKAGSASS